MNNALKNNNKIQRKRPFLIIKHTTKPELEAIEHDAQGNPTKMRNSKTEVRVDERAYIYERLKWRDEIEASIIIDLLNAKVLKNRFGKPDDDVFKHYVAEYKQEIGKYLAAWMHKNKIDGMITKEDAEKLKEKQNDKQ